MNSIALKAKTHPAEYLIHKYWARKPHNILGHYIDTYFKTGDVVIDPFCGSGVFLAEAKKRGLIAKGFDINPIACLISEVTTNPPKPEVLIREIEKILDVTKQKYSHLYTVNGISVRYLVHEMKTKCGNCGKIGSPSLSIKEKNKYYCKKCKSKLSFNLEKYIGTSIIQIYDKNNKKIEDSDLIATQEKLSNIQGYDGSFNKTLLVNRRILAFPNMKVSDLFTPRAFTLLSNTFKEAYKISDIKVRDSVLLFLTSAVAQCSRLIPYRNNLSTGGPAWTIPGFWVAPIHLETNPIIHLEARYKKFIKGLNALNKNYGKQKTNVEIKNIPAQMGLNKIKDNSLEGIFFDPPYGDNVPYVEFSEIWNSFLNKDIDYSNEIIVSDRKEHVSSWDKYSSNMEAVIKLFYEKLKNNGKVIMTFNNLDPRAWKIVLESFAKYPFKCAEAKYQIPAVISSKAQRASNTSYVGDYYCVFIKGITNGIHKDELFQVTEKIKLTLLSRGGIAPKNLINRIAILTILNENLNIGFIEKIQDAVIPIATSDGDYYHLRSELMDKNLIDKYSLERTIQELAVKELKTGKKSVDYLYEQILEKTDGLGSPVFSEVVNYLKGIVLFEKDYCYLQDNHIQMGLFGSSKN